jgi:predicted permease
VKAIRALRSRIAAMFRTSRLDAELDDEIRDHLAHLEARHRLRGLTPADARAAALRDFGGVAQIKESYRDQRGLMFIETFVQDLRYALRMMRRAPGFSLVVVAVLTLAIGANSAMFTFVDALLFRPLPGRAADLVGVYSHDPTQPYSYRSFSYPNYLDIRDRSDVFEQMIAFTPALAGRQAGDVMQRVFVEVVSANYFSAMHVALAAGRAFTAEEERPGANIAVAIANYAAWQQSGFDHTFMGRTVHLNGQDFTIVGVAPKGFTGTTAIIERELWVPLGMFDVVAKEPFRNTTGRGLGDRANHTLRVAGWLKPGIGVEQANARLAQFSTDLERAYPDENRRQVLSVHSMSRVNMSSSPSTDVGPAALSAVAMPLSGAVLLIACLNIANMLLARSSVRKKEIAIRLALGGGRGRIVRQLLTESLLLASIGAIGGLVLGGWTIQVLFASLVPIMPLPIHLESRPDANIVLVAAAFAVLSAVAFGLAPALRTTRPALVDDLKDLGGSQVRPRRFATRAWLVVGQIAVSLMLLTAGGLFARGALRATVADPGYSYQGLVLTSIDPSLVGDEAAKGSARVRAALDRIRQLPGVVAAGANSQVPFGDTHLSTAIARLGQKPLDGREPTFTTVTTDYFKTVGLPVVRGRDFTLAETAAPSRRVAIIDEPLARRLFANEDPLDQQIRIPPRDESKPAPENDPMTIVGIVPGIRDDLTERDPVAHVYVPPGVPTTAPMHIYARTTGSEEELLASIRRELRILDARLPIVELRTMHEFHDRGLVLWVIRAAGRTLMGLGALALLLAAIGVYGVKSYVVAQRTREIGIRLALGAAPRDIVLMLLRDGARLTIVGIAIGFPLAVVLGRLLSVAMFEVSPYDPLVLTAAPLVLAGVAALATYLPARRGMRVSPLEALRTE